MLWFARSDRDQFPQAVERFDGLLQYGVLLHLAEFLIEGFALHWTIVTDFYQGVDESLQIDHPVVCIDDTSLKFLENVLDKLWYFVVVSPLSKSSWRIFEKYAARGRFGGMQNFLWH